MSKPTPILITVEEMAELLRIKRTLAWELVRKREIKSIKIGRTRRVTMSAVQEYLNSLLDGDDAA